MKLATMELIIILQCYCTSLNLIITKIQEKDSQLKRKKEHHITIIIVLHKKKTTHNIQLMVANI